MNLPLRSLNVLAVSIALGASLTTARAGLIHRFSFSDTARDSVGSIEGKLKGPGASISGGQLVLKNDDSAAGNKISCLEFADSLLPKGGTTVSFAVWFTARDTGEFARILNFGDSEGTEGKQFIYFSPKTAEGLARAAITSSDVGSKTYLDFDALDDGKPHMVALVIDGAAKKLRVFVDGMEPKPAEPLGENTLDKVKPVENWLGKSSFAADPGLTGSIDELRVYDHALTAEESAAACKAGPDTLPPAATPPAK